MVIFHSYVNVYQRVVGNYELTRHTWKLFFFFKPLLGEVRNIGLVTAPHVGIFEGL
jgi:hypothetical protein